MRAAASSIGLGVLVTSACLSPLDQLGQDEAVRQSEVGAPDPLADDDIADKHPAYDPNLTTTEQFGPCSVVLNKSGAVTKLDVVPFAGIDDADSPLASALYPTMITAARAGWTAPVLPSMELVNQALKAFNDGLYAAIELGVEDGSSGSPIDKRQLLTDLATALQARATGGTAAEQPLAGEAASFVGAALQLGGGTPPAGIANVGARIADFQSAPLLSTPIGFYTWRPELSQIFLQDRLLQNLQPTPMSFGALASTAVVLNADAGLASRYGAVLDLYAGLTNPFFDRSARDLMPFATDASSLANLGALQSQFQSAYPQVSMPPADGTCFARVAIEPSSDSPENKLFRTLFCPDGQPSGNLLDTLIAAIRSGTVDLTPTATSGFYDRQLYALETLLVPDQAPEKDHLFLTKTYKQKLVDTFKALLIETRDTHVKQLEPFISVASSAAAPPTPVDVYPKLPVEPFPTFYLRTARAYVFLTNVLRSVLGDAFLSTATREHEDHSAGGTLASELADKTQLLYGLHAATAAAIGMPNQMTSDELALFPADAALARAAAFVSGWQDDADVAYDPRVIVPAAYDPNAGLVYYWAVFGVKPILSDARFYPGYEPQVVSPGDGCVFHSFIPRQSVLFTLPSAQVAIRASVPPLTRDKFRAMCDQYQTEDAIIAALQAL